LAVIVHRKIFEDFPRRYGVHNQPRQRVTMQTEENATARNIAIARAAYDAYVTKNRIAIEKVIAEDFRLVGSAQSPAGRLRGRRRSAVAGRTLIT
jgi:hypothetical protein